MYSGRSPTRPGTWATPKGSRGPGGGRNPYADSHGGPGTDPRVVRPRDVRPGATGGGTVRANGTLGQHGRPSAGGPAGNSARGRPPRPLAAPAGLPRHPVPPRGDLLPRPLPA